MLAEIVNGMFKNKLLLYQCNKINERKQLIDESVYTYNILRPHLSLNIKAPAKVHSIYLYPNQCKNLDTSRIWLIKNYQYISGYKKTEVKHLGRYSFAIKGRFIMKVVIIGTVAASFYGFRAELIKTLINHGHQVYAFTTDFRENDLIKIKQLGAIPIHYKLSRGGLNPFKDISSTICLAKNIKRIKPDIVFSYFSKPVIFGTLAAKLAKTPKVIGMLEGLGYFFTDQPEGIDTKTSIIKALQIILYKISLPKLDTFILLNHDDPIDLLERHNIKVKSIEILGGIGLDLEKFPLAPIPDLPFNFIFIARLLKEKGIFEFIEAATKVKEQYPNTKFTVLGAIDSENPGALKQDELDNLIQLNLIEYPGHVDNIQSWIANSHVFVLPSYREGLPRSTQEAMAIGRPVITTDVPGCRETVIDGLNGFIIEKWNPKALEDKIVYFIENPDQIEKMGLESYKIAQKKFDAEKTNQKLLKILGL